MACWCMLFCEIFGVKGIIECLKVWRGILLALVSKFFFLFFCFYYSIGFVLLDWSPFLYMGSLLRPWFTVMGITHNLTHSSFL